MILTDYFNNVELTQSRSNTSRSTTSSPTAILNNKLKKLLADNVIDGNEYTIMVNRISRMVELLSGDIEMLAPREDLVF